MENLHEKERYNHQQKESSLARGFRDVDAAGPAKMAQCLELLDSLPSFQGYKNRVLEAINPQRGAIIADLGCGLGFDVLRLARLVGPDGLAIGVDSSRALLESARSMSQNSAGIQFIHADIQNLPFDGGYLHACKVDRALQHIESPASVLREMFRSVRPGGMVVCAEPDWGTFTIDHENRTMVRRITEFWGESIRNPWIGRQLSNELRRAGFIDIEVHGALLTAPSFESSDKVFDLVQTSARLADAIASEEPLQWISDARESDRSHPVCSSVTLFMNFARRP